MGPDDSAGPHCGHTVWRCPVGRQAAWTVNRLPCLRWPNISATWVRAAGWSLTSAKANRNKTSWAGSSNVALLYFLVTRKTLKYTLCDRIYLFCDIFLCHMQTLIGMSRRIQTNCLKFFDILSHYSVSCWDKPTKEIYCLLQTEICENLVLGWICTVFNPSESTLFDLLSLRSQLQVFRRMF